MIGGFDKARRLVRRLLQKNSSARGGGLDLESRGDDKKWTDWIGLTVRLDVKAKEEVKNIHLQVSSLTSCMEDNAIY